MKYHINKMQVPHSWHANVISGNKKEVCRFDTPRRKNDVIYLRNYRIITLTVAVAVADVRRAM